MGGGGGGGVATRGGGCSALSRSSRGQGTSFRILLGGRESAKCIRAGVKFGEGGE